MRVRYSTKHTISIAIVFLLLFSIVPCQVAYASSPETYYSGSADGCVGVGGSSAKTWATVHHATSGDYITNTSTGTTAESYESTEGTSYNAILRSFLPFDTSGLPDTATITAATLNIYVTATVDSDNDGYDYVSVVQTTQASATSLVLDDYDQCGAIQSPQKGAADIDITGISSSAYLTFTLNATGIGWISLTGWTQLGIREGHDVDDHQILANKDNGVTYSSSEASGTSQDPYLSITYTVPSGEWHDVSTWSFVLTTRQWISIPTWMAQYNLTVNSIADSYVHSLFPDTNYGTNITLRVMGESANARSFLNFSFADLPADANVTSVKLRLYAYGVLGGVPCNASRVVGAWTETGITWNNQPTVNFTNSVYVGVGLPSGWKEFEITEMFEDAMQLGSNISVRVHSNSEGGMIESEAYFNSWEATSNKPELVINYEKLSTQISFYLQTRIWMPISTWALNLLARQYIAVASWLFDFGTRIWVDAATWTYNWVTMAWENITWIFYLGTSIWTDIATWATNLAAMMWNNVATWLFTLLPSLPEWVNVAVWIFSLRSPEWMLVALWNLQLGAGGIAFLFIAILLLIVIVAGIIAIAYRRPKQ